MNDLNKDLIFQIEWLQSKPRQEAQHIVIDMIVNRATALDPSLSKVAGMSGCFWNAVIRNN